MPRLCWFIPWNLWFIHGINANKLGAIFAAYPFTVHANGWNRGSCTDFDNHCILARLLLEPRFVGMFLFITQFDIHLASLNIRILGRAIAPQCGHSGSISCSCRVLLSICGVYSSPDHVCAPQGVLH